MAFAPVVEEESYRMRSVPGGHPGDRVERRVRMINGKRYEFTRVRWGNGSVTVRAYRGHEAQPFRVWTGGSVWTDPDYLGCDCVPGTGLGCEATACVIQREPRVISPYGAETLGFSLD